MTTKLLILLDSGSFKAYRFEDSEEFSTPRLRLVEQWDTEVHDRLSDRLTDQAGQFKKGAQSFAAINDMSNGERHNLHLEQRRRALKRMASRVKELLASQSMDGFYLAAANDVNQSFLDTLDGFTRGKLEKNITSNLTRLNPPEVVRHFCVEAA